MGWRGVARSVNAEINRAAREAEKRRRLREKELIAEHAENVVHEHENHIESLTTLHHERRKAVSWSTIRDSSAPSEPVRSTSDQRRAKAKLDRYSPSWFDTLLNREKNKRAKLTKKLRQAIQQEERAYQTAIKDWKVKTAEWERSVKLARRVLAGDDEAWVEAIAAYSIFSTSDKSNSNPPQVEIIGEGKITIDDDKNVHISIHTFGDKLVPTETHKQLQSGKLSTRNMPKGQYWNIYLNYVASCAIRTATEILAVLPIDTIFVTILEEKLNPATGHIEPTPILSVQVPRRTLQTMNLSAAQAGPALTQFNHAIDFRKTQGFRAVEPLMP